jgi:hypothetical protein
MSEPWIGNGIIRLLWLSVLVLTGCAGAAAGDTGSYHITNYAPSPLAPNNCGTPYKFKRCITSLPRRPRVYIEQLDVFPGSTPADDMPLIVGNP